GPVSRKPGLELYAVALRAGRYGLCKLGAVPEMLDRPRVCARKTEDSATRARHRLVQSGATRSLLLARLRDERPGSSPSLCRPDLARKGSRCAHGGLPQSSGGWSA